LDDPGFTVLFEHRRQECSGDLTEDAGRLSLRAMWPNRFSFAIRMDENGTGSWSLERAGTSHWASATDLLKEG
jgi:hypothetical protein